MNAEYLAAVASLVTALIIGATAIAALVQLHHMRAANSINVALSLENMLTDERHVRARELIRGGAAEKAMEDPEFRRYLRAFFRGGRALDSDAGFAELNSNFALVANLFTVLGFMVRRGTLSKAEIVGQYKLVIMATWQRLEQYIDYIRVLGENNDIWDSFEYLTVLSQNDVQRHPSVYPPGVRRIPVQSTYPLAKDLEELR